MSGIALPTLQLYLCSIQAGHGTCTNTLHRLLASTHTSTSAATLKRRTRLSSCSFARRAALAGHSFGEFSTRTCAHRVLPRGSCWAMWSAGTAWSHAGSFCACYQNSLPTVATDMVLIVEDCLVWVSPNALQ